MVELTVHFLTGMAKIERAMAWALKDAGLDSVTPAFRWNRDAAPVPVPESVALEITCYARRASVSFTREQIVDCRTRVDRPDVLAAIAEAVKQLGGVASSGQ
jgi:hypothetical protein